MKRASITETKNQLSALIDAVRHGETVLILDRNRPVARLESVVTADEQDAEGRLARLERCGVLRRGRRRLSKSFLAGPLPKPRKGASILDALLAERRDDR